MHAAFRGDGLHQAKLLDTSELRQVKGKAHAAGEASFHPVSQPNVDTRDHTKDAGNFFPLPHPRRIYLHTRREKQVPKEENQSRRQLLLSCWQTGRHMPQPP